MKYWKAFGVASPVTLFLVFFSVANLKFFFLSSLISIKPLIEKGLHHILDYLCTYLGAAFRC
jgi:hypothetical protein